MPDSSKKEANAPAASATVVDDIQRASEVTRLAGVLAAPGPGLSVVGISGPGGVGKSYLLAHVLDQLEPVKAGYLVLRADGSNPDTRNDFFGVVDAQLFRRSLDAPADPAKDYFPHLREIVAEHRSVSEEALHELAKRGAPEKVQQAARLLLRAGRVFNAAGSLPSRRLLEVAMSVDDRVIAEGLDVAWDLVRELKGLRDSTTLPGPLRDLFGVTRRNRVKRDLYAVTAGEIRTDLAAALAGYEPGDSKKLVQQRIKGLDRLLLVIDDYEASAELLGDFLVGALVPALAAAPFSTVIVILGRDDLKATHPGWDQHCRRYVKEQIRLTPFDEAGTNRLFAEAGIEPSRWPALYEATQGFPFLISLASEEATEAEAQSVVFLRRFYDRTTRWMNERERDWFERVCYLDRVDEDTLRTLFEPADVSAVQDWFERESSIRDPAAAFFRVRPMVREKVLRYLEVRRPNRHRELLSAAGERAG